MKQQYHILNGDALNEQFPESIRGEIIIARECFVDGNVEGRSLTELYKSRAHFISQSYEGFTTQDYYDKTVSELNKIQNIRTNAEINLWFEDDLFCQVNFWFTINLLANSNRENTFFLIRPQAHNQYGFGGLNSSGLRLVYEARTLLTEVDLLTNLWKHYQHHDITNLLKTAEALQAKYPFILTATKAHIERIPNEGNLGRPVESLIEIMKELDTKNFGLIFREFSKREAIYGFGDFQVKKLVDEINNDF